MTPEEVERYGLFFGFDAADGPDRTVVSLWERRRIPSAERRRIRRRRRLWVRQFNRRRFEIRLGTRAKMDRLRSLMDRPLGGLTQSEHQEVHCTIVDVIDSMLAACRRNRATVEEKYRLLALSKEPAPGTYLWPPKP